MGRGRGGVEGVGIAPLDKYPQVRRAGGVAGGRNSLQVEHASHYTVVPS